MHFRSFCGCQEYWNQTSRASRSCLSRINLNHGPMVMTLQSTIWQLWSLRSVSRINRYLVGEREGRVKVSKNPFFTVMPYGGSRNLLENGDWLGSKTKMSMDRMRHSSLPHTTNHRHFTNPLLEELPFCSLLSFLLFFAQTLDTHVHKLLKNSHCSI